ncbi:MAG: hypothetical protein JSW06_02780 [Thermoplasmatales archaeon]|nr:MAG: hypothetical protein JSW06_02780 [Thermoplasmatales archaeon]
MAIKVGEVYIDAEVKTDKVTKGKKKTESELKKLQKSAKTSAASISSSFSNVGAVLGTLGVALAGVTAILSKTISAASDLQEQTQKFGVVFSDVREQANRFARELQTSYGLSIRESRQLLASTGDLLAGFGFTQQEALRLSNRVQRLSVDLASFNDLQGGAAQASEILTKALLGERDSLVSLGIKITDAQIRQRALAEGIPIVNGRIGQQAQAQITLALATEQSGNAIGDFARSQGSFANQSRILNARLEDAAGIIGEELLPAATAIVETFAEIVQQFTNADSALRRFIRSLSIQAQLEFRIERRREALRRKKARRLGITVEQIEGAPRRQRRRQTRRRGAVAAARRRAPEPGKLETDLEQQAAQFENVARSELEIIRERNQNELKLLQDLRAQQLITNEQYVAARQRQEQQILQAQVNNAQQGLNFVSGVVGQLGAIFSQVAQNRLSALASAEAKENKAIKERSDRQRKRAKETIKNEKKLAEALEKIDEDQKKAEAETAEKFEKKRREVQRENFIRQQRIAVLQAIINTAQASTKALAQVGFFGGPAAAAFIAALGAIQVALIASQKPPPLQQGGIVKSKTFVEAGEVNPEAVVPLGGVEGQRAFNLLASKILENLEVGAGQAADTELQVTREDTEGGDIYLTIQLADEFWQEKISKGTRDRTIIIDKGAVQKTI